jgi:AcrR family transcriptional regulator
VSSYTPALRADARRNREQILVAAGRSFVDDGIDVSMDRIARDAGVGTGTLYRRFPDRETLFVAVVQHNLESLLAKIRAAAAEEPRAWDALVRSMSYSRELRLLLPSSSMLPPALAAAVRDDPALRRLRSDLTEVCDELVAAAQRDGTLRPDVGAGDVTQLFAMVYRATPTIADETADLASARALAVILDGLRADRHDPLPGRPLETSDLQRLREGLG